MADSVRFRFISKMHLEQYLQELRSGLNWRVEMPFGPHAGDGTITPRGNGQDGKALDAHIRGYGHISVLEVLFPFEYGDSNKQLEQAFQDASDRVYVLK